MRKLIRSMPEVAKQVFNLCTRDNGLRQEDAGYTIKFDYSFIDDTYIDFRPDLTPSEPNDDVRSAVSDVAGSGDKGRPLGLSLNTIFDELGHLLPDAKPYTTDTGTAKLSHCLMLMVRWQRQELLSHPLVRSLLRHKWNSHGRYVYYSFLAVYALLVGLLTAFVVLTPPTYQHYQPHENPAHANISFNQACILSGVQRHPAATACKFGILVLTVFHALKELFQIYQRGRNYMSWENLVEWVVYVSSFFFVVDFTVCTRDTGLRMVRRSTPEPGIAPVQALSPLGGWEVEWRDGGR